jgi:hypothetical protein
MLANGQFIDKMAAIIDEQAEVKNQVIR